MRRQELGENISLINFTLDNQEMVIAKKMIGNYISKIKKIVGYKEIKLEMKVIKKAEKREYEMKNALFYEHSGMQETANADARGFNPFSVIDETFKKIINELNNRIRT